jgi:hypothetical protein
MQFLHGNIVSNKFDIFSLGVVMIKIIAGHEAYSRSVEMHRGDFVDLVRNAMPSPPGKRMLLFFE